jgi:transcriptional regulator with XRE-family HTH domain
MSKFDLKLKAFKLRRRGLSLLDISKKLGVSKGTVSLWCSEIVLSESQRTLLEKRMRAKGKIGALLGAQANRQKKIKAIDEAQKWAKMTIKDLSVRDKLIAGIALYWAEGSKAKSTTGFIFVNSDPKMIKFMFDWLINIIHLPKNDIVVGLAINQIHQYRLEEVLNFWSDLLDLPRSQFLNTFLKKVTQKKVYENMQEHYGVLRLGVRRSTFLKYKTLALINILKPV